MRCADCRLRYACREAPGDRYGYDDAYTSDGLYDMHVAAGEALVRGDLPPIVRAKRIALERLAAQDPGCLLEIGCGNGTFLAHASRVLRGRLHGIDISANALAIAGKHLTCPLHQGEFSDEAFPGQRFDAICTWEVIEHVPDVRGWVQRIRARLSPGGTLMLCTPNYGSHWIWKDMPNDPRSRPPVHVTFWDADTLGSLLRSSGFDSVEIRELSVPNSAARRVGGTLASVVCYAESLVSSRSRATLLAVAS